MFTCVLLFTCVLFLYRRPRLHWTDCRSLSLSGKNKPRALKPRRPPWASAYLMGAGFPEQRVSPHLSLLLRVCGKYRNSDCFLICSIVIITLATLGQGKRSIGQYSEWGVVGTWTSHRSGLRAGPSGLWHGWGTTGKDGRRWRCVEAYSITITMAAWPWCD